MFNLGGDIGTINARAVSEQRVAKVTITTVKR